MSFKTPTELWGQWQQLCQSQFDLKNQFGVTVGLELEFFLLNAQGNPVTLSESQKFMRSLESFISKDKKGVTVEHEELGGKECISKVKFPTSKTSWTYVCYEYPPHLLEVSFSYHLNLTPLEQEVDFILKTIKAVAIEVGLTAQFSPTLSKEQRSSMHLVDNELQKSLKTSRIQMLEEGPFADEIHLADFPSYLAASHVHVGGHEWWKDPQFVENLYRIEPYVMLEAKGINFKERWEHYLKVFHNFPLVGFPKTRQWTLDWWITQLFVTSYQRQKEKLKDHRGLNKLRDLQVIRPRAIGTIEFRSDAAQANTADLMYLAALRFGQFLLAMKTLPHSIPGYEKSYDLWYTQLRDNQYQSEKTRAEVMQLIEMELRRRGLGEEKYLHPMKNKLGKSA